jgi:hypothetical protein
LSFRTAHMANWPFFIPPYFINAFKFGKMLPIETSFFKRNQ